MGGTVHTSNNAQRRALSVRGGGGIRTPVPGRPSGSSTGVATGSCLASRLPVAEDPSASPSSMSVGGPQAQPPASACSRRPHHGGRRPAGDGYLSVLRQRAPVQSWHLCLFRLLTRHPETSARFPQTATVRVDASSPPY